MIKIVVAQPMDFSPEEENRLKKLGDVVFYDSLARDYNEWLKRCKDADVILTGKFGLKQKYQELHDKFISVPFVGIGFIDKKNLKKNNLTVAFSPGCNKDAVSEWIIAMLLNLFRKFPRYIRATDLKKGKLPEPALSLTGKKVCILGKGNVGSRVGKLCKCFDMNVDFFSRGNNLYKKVKTADVVIDCLGYNKTTHGLLDKKFFNSMKKGSFFITVTIPKIWNAEAMLQALKEGILAGAATDTQNIQIGDVYDSFYRKLLKNPKLLVTPHIAYNSDISIKVGNRMMIENVEAWMKKKPINLLKL